MDFSWIWEQVTTASAGAGLWLALSFLLAGLTTGLARLFAPRLERTVRVVRWISLPYLGLVLGELSPRSMGISFIDWSLGLRVGLVVLVGMSVLLAIVRIWLHTDKSPPPGGRIPGPSSLIMWIGSGAQEFHWCFLRGAALDLLMSLSAADQATAYWSVWLGAAFALPGVILHSRHNSDRMVNAAILLSTTSLFLYTRNFWLSWLLHAGIRAVIQSRQPPSQGQAWST